MPNVQTKGDTPKRSLNMLKIAGLYLMTLLPTLAVAYLVGYNSNVLSILLHPEGLIYFLIFGGIIFASAIGIVIPVVVISLVKLRRGVRTSVWVGMIVSILCLGIAVGVVANGSREESVQKDIESKNTPANRDDNRSIGLSNALMQVDRSYNAPGPRRLPASIPVSGPGSEADSTDIKYEVLGPNSFKLCGTFETDTTKPSGSDRKDPPIKKVLNDEVLSPWRDADAVYIHREGEQCYTFEYAENR